MMRTATLLVTVAGAGLAAAGASQAQAIDASGDTGAGAERIILAQSGGFEALRARTKGPNAQSSRDERSRGDDNAADRAVEQADENSAVGGPEADAIPPDLSNLEIGLTVRGADGVEIGTIERVNKSSDGTVRSVIVARANGQGNLTLAPGSLSVSGDVVTTTTVVPQD